MNRRSALKIAAGATIAGSAGCTQLLPSRQQHSLWFVRIHNGGTTEQRVEIRVRRDGELLFDRVYEGIPSFQETRTENASFAAMDSARLIEGEWDVRPGAYSIEYRLAGQDSFERVAVAGMGEFDVEHIGVDMQLYGSGHDRTPVGFGVLEFDSADQAAQFVTTVATRGED